VIRPSRSTVRLIVRDARETTEFWRQGGARANGRADASTCVTPEDFCSFTDRRFVRGAAQNQAELAAFIRYAAADAPRVVCEIGVQDGGTNFVLSRALSSVTTVVGIDLYVSLKAQLRYFRRPGVELHLIQGSSHTRRTRKRLRAVLAWRPIDLLFIDGDHTFDGAARDFALYSPLVRPGGLIAFHDIVEDSYSRCGIRTESYVGEVPRLWKSLREQYAYREFIDDPSQDGRGIGVIRYDPLVDLPLHGA
jgi:predicted O-methyltransferase YrrM